MPRTHDLSQLADVMPKDRALRVEVQDLATLTPYAVEARYPPVNEEFVTREDADQAVAIARRVRAELREWLPTRS